MSKRRPKWYVVVCRQCDYDEDEVKYSPDQGFKLWKCPKCGAEYDLYLLWNAAYNWHRC